MKKNLVVIFCAIRPAQLTLDHQNSREVEYNICLSQILRLLPETFDYVICDNTITDISQLKHAGLQDIFKNSPHLFLPQNIGVHNKGMGEIHMLKAASLRIEFDKYETVSYCTGRKLFTCPYVFERTQTMKKSAMISNPDFLFLNGELQPTEKNGMYNDMFFSMKGPIMKRYADESFDLINENLQNHIGSEQNLYNFIKRNNIDYEWLNWLGLLRNDWERNNNPLDINNIHIC